MIPIRNVYYMLAYAFQVLNEQGYKDVATEEFENVAELCAAILIKGISIQLKRGLNREYIELLSVQGSPSSKFWALEKRIREDQRDSGVQARMSRSNMKFILMDLLDEAFPAFLELCFH